MTLNIVNTQYCLNVCQCGDIEEANIHVALWLCVQFSCGFRVENSGDQFIPSHTSYFVGIWFWAVSKFTLHSIFLRSYVEFKCKTLLTKMLLTKKPCFDDSILLKSKALKKLQNHLLPAVIQSWMSSHIDSFNIKLHSFVRVVWQGIRFSCRFFIWTFTRSLVLKAVVKRKSNKQLW